MAPKGRIHWWRKIVGTVGGNFIGGGRLMAPLALGQINWWRKVEGTSGADSFTKGAVMTSFGQIYQWRWAGLITF